MGASNVFSVSHEMINTFVIMIDINGNPVVLTYDEASRAFVGRADIEVGGSAQGQTDCMHSLHNS
jgi:hypothetical protein